MRTHILVVTAPTYATAYAQLRAQLDERAPHLDPGTRIITVVNGDAVDTCEPDTHTLRQRCNLFEYGAFVAVHRALKDNILPGVSPDDHFLLLHDTVKLTDSGADMATKLMIASAELASKGADVYWCLPDGQFNICVFTARMAAAVHGRWGTTHTMNKQKAIALEFGPDDKDSPKNYKDVRHVYATVPKREHPGLVRFEPSSPHLRIAVHIPSLGIDKYVYDRNRQPDVRMRMLPHPNAI